MCDCKDCNCQSGDSGFIFGLVIGAVIGAAVAVYIYKNNKTDVFSDLREKLENYFKKFTSPPEPEPEPAKKSPKSAKIAVILPKEIVKETTPVKSVTSKPRKFVKPKK